MHLIGKGRFVKFMTYSYKGKKDDNYFPIYWRHVL